MAGEVFVIGSVQSESICYKVKWFFLMGWQPPEHRPIDKPPGGSQSFLGKGLNMCKGIIDADDREWKPGAALHDTHGTYAYTADASDTELPVFKLLLIARKYIMGNLVGAGAEVIARCIAEKRHLLIYIFEANKIYVLDAEKCKAVGMRSSRGAGSYFDFPIKLGVNLVKFLDDLRKGKDTKDKLDEYFSGDKEN